MLNIKKNKGFSLAEMMVVMLMLSIIFAAAAPILTKRATQTAEIKASNGSGVPVGTVIMWMSTTLPQGDETGKWLECNGATFSATTYPDLKNVLGSTTLPNFIGRFPQGNSTPKTYKSAGLPNITGQTVGDTHICYGYSGWADAVKKVPNNAFSPKASESSAANGPYAYFGAGYYFDASKSNSIYGSSTTVQPPAITVKYLIKAKS